MGSALTLTGCFFVALWACSCFSARTGRRTCLEHSASDCECSCSWLIRLNSLNLSVFFFCVFFLNYVLLLNGFCRVDVTEVQIAIVIMYIMTAFGGVSLWETRVRQSPSLTDRPSECLSHNIHKFTPIIITETVYTRKVHCGQSQHDFK